ncbi:MAG: polysaccharide deacetylase family protein [Gemmatimonadota bacterium]
MTLVSTVKDGIFRLARQAGVMSLVRQSGWRRRRLLILCYHGISIDDEHEWNPALYMRQDVFRRRLAALARSNQVLSLDEGLRRLHDGTLPNAAVAITVDDGAFDFYARAWPVLEELSLPATVYQTTYYAENNRPVFDTFASYLLWKARTRRIDLSSLVALEGAQDLSQGSVRDAVHVALMDLAQRDSLDAERKDALLESLADLLDVDIAALRATRILHLMTPAEIAELAARGIDFQLHTHRHRTPDDAAEFAREIDDNRQRIETLTHRTANHFCYPSGVYREMYLRWLRDANVLSATTCDPGMATVESPSLLLPRLVDTMGLSDLTFEAWSSGVAELLPRRTRRGSGASVFA